jgi:hypothetical protein
MRKFLHFWRSVVAREWTSYKVKTACLLSVLTSWLIKENLTLFLFPGKSFGGRNFWFQSGIFSIYILIAYLFFWYLVVILCSLFPKAALQSRQMLDSWRKSVKGDHKIRIYLALLILGLGIGSIYFINNVLTSIDTSAWMFRVINPVPAAAYPVGIDFRMGLYKTANAVLFGAHYPGFNSDYTYPSVYPPLVNILTSPFLLLDENSAYLVQIGLLFFGNIACLLLVAWMARKYLFSDLGLEGITTGLIAVFISFVILFYTLSSYPFMFSIERGNYDIVALLFALAAVVCLFKFPRNIWLQVILLSIASNLKIYPGILFVLLFFKQGKRIIFPTILVNIVFLFILGAQNALGFLQRMFNYTVGSQPDGWVGNHSANSFAVLIQNNSSATLPITSGLLSGVFTLIPIILWCVVVILLFRHKYSERNALLLVMVSIPLMDIIPTSSFDYKSVILSSAAVLLVALLIRNVVLKSSLIDFIQLGAVILIILFIGRSYVFFNPAQFMISNKYLWSLLLETLMVFNIIRNHYTEMKIGSNVKPSVT